MPSFAHTGMGLHRLRLRLFHLCSSPTVNVRLRHRSTDDRYFGDPWQALPRRGYTRIFENMLLDNPMITIRLNVDFFKAREAGLLPKHGMLVYTGQIDSYYAQLGMPKA